MANKERNKRSARKARSRERAEQEALLKTDSETTSKTKVAQTSASQNKSSKPQKKAVAKKKDDGIIAHFKNYFSAVRTEMRRVVWPSREELKNYSVGAAVMLVVAGVVIWLVDTGIMLILAALSGLRG